MPSSTAPAPRDSVPPASASPASASSDDRPLLRGWIHAFTLPFAGVGLFLLMRSVATASLQRQLSVAVFGVCLVGLYAVSSLYHVPRWNARVRYALSRCDVAMIQLFIAGTFTPIAWHALDGGWRRWSLVIAWTIAVTGAAIAASPLTAPRWVSTLSYVAIGWLAVVPMVKIITALPWEGTGLIVLGGLLYTLGAVVYARRWPDPLPSWFGYHEVFHLLVVAASTCHYLAIWRYVLPIS